MMAHAPSCELLQDSLEQLLQLRLHMIQSRRVFRRQPNAAKGTPQLHQAPSLKAQKQLNTASSSTSPLSSKSKTALESPVVAAVPSSATVETAAITSTVAKEEAVAEAVEEPVVALSRDELVAAASKEKFCDEMLSWWEQHPDDRDDEDVRINFADYLTEMYLAQQLDPLPSSPMIAKVRRFVAEALEEFVSEGLTPELLPQLKDGRPASSSKAASDGGVGKKMDLTSLNQAMATESHSMYMEPTTPRQPGNSSRRNSSRRNSQGDQDAGQLTQLRQEYNEYLVAKKKEEDQIKAYNDLASEIQSVLQSVRTGQS